MVVTWWIVAFLCSDGLHIVPILFASGALNGLPSISWCIFAAPLSQLLSVYTGDGMMAHNMGHERPNLHRPYVHSKHIVHYIGIVDSNT